MGILFIIMKAVGTVVNSPVSFADVCLELSFVQILLLCILREVRRRRMLEKRGEDFKKEGRIYRLRREEDTDDDNNTWNGNSTQQM